MTLLAHAAVALLAACLATPVLAQSAGNPAPVSPAKKALVARILELQRPGIEGLASNVAAAPALQMRQQLGPILQQRIAPERREALARDLEADMRKYVEETTPILRDRALRLAPSTIGPMLEERFTEDELKQVVAMLESPVNRKFQTMAGEMQRALGEKLVAETRGTIEPKVKALQQTVTRRLEPAPAASAPRN